MTKTSPQTSTRSNNLYIEIPVWAEEFLMRIIGKSMLYIHGQRSIKTWKGILNKIAKTIDKSITKNIESDGLHSVRLKKFSRELEEATTSKDYSQLEIILPLVGIIFELIGRTPNYRERKIMNRKDDFIFSDLRSIEYKQSSSQKVQTILEASKQKPYYDFHRYDDLFEKYVSNFNGKPLEFIQWYKKEYPQVYLELF